MKIHKTKDKKKKTLYLYRVYIAAAAESLPCTIWQQQLILNAQKKSF
jgi:hypothetical protein